MKSNFANYHQKTIFVNPRLIRSLGALAEWVKQKMQSNYRSRKSGEKEINQRRGNQRNGLFEPDQAAEFDDRNHQKHPKQQQKAFCRVKDGGCQ